LKKFKLIIDENNINRNEKSFPPYFDTEIKKRMNQRIFEYHHRTNLLTQNLHYFQQKIALQQFISTFTNDILNSLLS